MELIKSLLPVVYVILGWSLNLITEKLKTNLSRIKSVNSALYKLLSLRSNYMKLAEFDTNFNYVINKYLEKRNIVKNDLADKETIHIINFVKKELRLSKSLVSINDQIKEDIKAIALYDPVTAFDLDSNYDLNEIIELLSKVSHDQSISMSSSDAIFISDIFETRVLTDLIEKIEVAITSLLESASRKTRKRTSAILAKKKKFNTEELDIMVNKIFTTLNKMYYHS